MDKVLQLLSQGCRADAIDVIYNTLDDLCLSGNFSIAKDIIGEITGYILNKDVPLSIFLSVAVITWPWRKELEPEREQFMFTLSVHHPNNDFIKMVT